jgi:phosphoglycolate phosphatase-like HAD superfamily hydrolase
MRLLVLDFDGVICDSVEECFLSSWNAYHGLHRGAAVEEAPARARAEFRSMRPFARSGEDFVLIQELVGSGMNVNSQVDFDGSWGRAGLPSRAEFKELFYRARTELLAADRRRWLSLNTVHPHVAAALPRLHRGVPLYILSTKKPQFVREILAANGLDIPEDHVLYSEEEPKLSTVERVRASLGCEEAVFIEDQIDAIRDNPNPRIRAFLASWGYVQESWLRGDTGVSILSAEGFSDLLAGLTD